MDYYCDVCLKYIEPNSKYSQFKAKFHQEIGECKHIILSHKDFDINDTDEAFYLYIIEPNKKFDYYLIKCEFKLVFNDYDSFPGVKSKLIDNKTKIPWKTFLQKVIDDFKDFG